MPESGPVSCKGSYSSRRLSSRGAFSSRAVFCSRHAGALLSSLDKRRAEYARRHQPCRWTRLQTVRVRQWHRRRRQRKLVYSQRQFGIRGSARMLHRSRRALFKAVYCNASGRVFGQGAPSDGSSRHHDASIQRRCAEIDASDCSPLSLSLRCRVCIVRADPSWSLARIALSSRSGCCSYRSSQRRSPSMAACCAPFSTRAPRVPCPRPLSAARLCPSPAGWPVRASTAQNMMQRSRRLQQPRRSLRAEGGRRVGGSLCRISSSHQQPAAASSCQQQPAAPCIGLHGAA